MTTTVLFSFKDDYYPPQVRKPIHLEHHTDNFPHDTKIVMQGLAGVADKIWRGEAPDLTRLELPLVDRVFLKETLEAACRIRPIPWRYEIAMCDGRILGWKEFRHEAQGIEELEAKHKEALARVAEVMQQMEKAEKALTYRASGYGNHDDLKR
jgi:hypothetical protein